MKFKTSTYIVPLVDVGTYWGQLSYDSLWESEESALKDDGCVVCADYDHVKFGDAVVKEATKMFADAVPLKECGVKSVVATKFISPLEYNFCDDALDLEVEVEDDFLERAKKEILDPANRDKVKKYIDGTWKSRDGFSSHMPVTDIDELPLLFDGLEAGDRLEADEYRDYGSVMALLWYLHGGHNADDDDYDDDDYDGCAECSYRNYSYDLRERIEGDYSLGDFATVLSNDEVRHTYAGHLMNFSRFRKQLKEDADKYKECGVGKDSQKRADSFVEKVEERIKYYEDCQRDLVSINHPNVEKAIDCLDHLRSEWNKEKNSEKWQEFWK